MNTQNKLFTPLILISIILAPIIASIRNNPSVMWLLVGAQIALLLVCEYIALKSTRSDKLKNSADNKQV